MIESFRLYQPQAELVLVSISTFSNSINDTLKSKNIETKFVNEVVDTKNLDFLKESRSYIEYLYSLPSVIISAFMEKLKNFDYIVYLDADLYFYSDPMAFIKDIPKNSISIIEHRFSTRLAAIFSSSGRYNVSWVGMPINDLGKICSADWSHKCIESTSADARWTTKGLVYGDQGYLDLWPEHYGDNIHVIENVGAGVAPWNFEKYVISKNPPIMINGFPLIFYHFSSHQFGFLLARKMGVEYSRIKKYPKGIYRIYESHLIKSAHDLKIRNWKSRYQPFYTRLINWIRRKLV
jgi:hypothetical protein